MSCLWNAWILMLYYPLHPIIMILVDKVAGTGDTLKKMGGAPYKRGQNRAFLGISLATMSWVFLLLSIGFGLLAMQANEMDQMLP